MNRLFSGRSDMPFALLLLAPSLLLLGGLVAWPMVSNIEISFLRLPLNPNIESTFVGVSNYVRILSDPGFWHSLWMTVWYTALVVAGSTVLGLAVAMFFNREFRLRKTARSLVILSYVTPSISLVFAWKYMFNNGYGIVNGTVAKLAMRQPFVLFKGLTFQKLCLPGAFRPGDHHNK
ncbi:carbohydrate ABC transporter permease, partial [Escherichia coli]